MREIRFNMRNMPTIPIARSARISVLAALALAATHTPVRAEVPYGLVDVHDPDTQIPESVRPLFDTPIRDTQICRGPDGDYYMTGTTAHDGGSMGAWNAGIHVWKSKDLKNWEPLGLVVDLDKMDSWISKFYIWPKDHSEPGKVLAREELPQHLTELQKTHQIRRCAWANEIHYVPSQKTFFIVGSMNHNIWIPPKHRIGHGLNGATFMLRSISGKAEGPYVDVQPDRPMTGEIDSSLFIDDDGTGYFVYQAHGIARIKKDFTGLAEKPRITEHKPIQGVLHAEGAYLFKANGKYRYVTTSWSVEKKGGELFTYDHSKGMEKYSYDPLLATADHVYGPYGEMRNTLSGGGHGNYFQDHEGKWWGCIFWNPGNKNNPPGLQTRPAIVAMKWTDEDRFVVDRERTDAFYASSHRCPVE